MRIDEIDLIGLVKVSGATSGSGKVLSYTETGLNWATASSVASTSTIKKSGYNYIIVETVKTGDENADAITNGDRLVAAYAQAKLDIIGTLSATNRFTIILMPGSYDLYNNNSYLDLDTSFIDIVGLSSNPGSVYLYHSTTSHVFNYHQDVDSRLENVKMGGFVIINNGVDTGQYLRWKNLILSNGDPFNSLWIDINGEFENIKSIGGFAISVISSLNGIYKNIESTGNSFTMANAGTPTLTGTFSNIVINQVVDYAFYNLQGNITGYFEDISISLDPAGTGNQVVLCANDINGTFKNVKVTNNEPINTFFYSGGSIFGTYKNIEVLSSSAVSAFSSSGLTMSGIFEDIYLPTSTYAFETTQDIFGTFSNITVGDVTTGGFMYAPTQVSGNFSDIKVGSVASYVFYGGTVEGKFKNIEIGTANASSFYGSTTLSGIFENIKINNVVGTVELFYSVGNLLGEYSNIEIYNIDSNISLFTSSTGDIDIKIKNFRFTNLSAVQCNVFYSPTGNIFGTYEDLYLGDVGSAFSMGLVLNISVKNMTVNYVSALFTANGIYGTYENINLIGQSAHGTVFVSSTGDINITLDGFYSKASVGGSFFEIQTTGSILGSYKNIRTSNLNDESFRATTGINAIFENIYILNGNSTNDIWSSVNDDFYGTFSNVEIGANFDNVFYAQGFTYYVNMKNVKIGPSLGYIFYGTLIHGSSYLENFYTTNRIPATFDGEMVNSEVDGITRWGDGFSLEVGDGVRIRNCKILGSQSSYGISIPTGTASITHTLLYAGITGSNVSPNYNITGYRY